jgi:hypothetical protein
MDPMANPAVRWTAALLSPAPSAAAAPTPIPGEDSSLTLTKYDLMVAEMERLKGALEEMRVRADMAALEAALASMGAAADCAAGAGEAGPPPPRLVAATAVAVAAAAQPQPTSHGYAGRAAPSPPPPPAGRPDMRALLSAAQGVAGLRPSSSAATPSKPLPAAAAATPLGALQGAMARRFAAMTVVAGSPSSNGSWDPEEGDGQARRTTGAAAVLARRKSERSLVGPSLPPPPTLEVVQTAPVRRIEGAGGSARGGATRPSNPLASPPPPGEGVARPRSLLADISGFNAGKLKPAAKGGAVKAPPPPAPAPAPSVVTQMAAGRAGLRRAGGGPLR